jgi:hypothetical protein
MKDSLDEGIHHEGTEARSNETATKIFLQKKTKETKTEWKDFF